jgi:hypothetical protein
MGREEGCPPFDCKQPVFHGRYDDNHAGLRAFSPRLLVHASCALPHTPFAGRSRQEKEVYEESGGKSC